MAKKRVKKNPADHQVNTRMIKDKTEKKSVHSMKGSSDLTEPTPDSLIHELKEHQVELEIQVEELRRTLLTLRESQDKYIDLYDFAPVGYFTLTSEAQIMEANLTGATMLGIARQDLIQNQFRRFVSSKEYDRWDHFFLTVLKQGDNHTCELELKREDGIEFSARICCVRVDTGDGSFQTRISLSYVTERKQDENEIVKGWDIWERTFNAVPDLISIIDTNFRIVQVNKAMADRLGVSPDAAIGLTCYKSVHHSSCPPGICPHQLLITDGRPHTVDIHEDSLNGDFTLSVSPVFDSCGKVEGSVHVLHDISERKRAEKALQESERRMKDTISFLPDATFVIDKNGIILAWNRAMEEMTGVPAQQMIGKANYEYALPFYHERRPMTIDLVFHDDPDVARTYLVMQKDGNSLFSENFIPHLNKGRGAHLWFTASPLYDTAGNLTGAIESIRDITDRKQIEETLRKSQNLLGEAMDLANMANWEYDIKSGIFTFNDRFFALYGTTVELEGGYQMSADMYTRKFVHPDDASVVVEEVEKILKTTNPYYVSQREHRIIRRDGEIRHIVVRLEIRKDTEGRTIKTYGVNQDITNRKQIEEALYESNKKLNILSSITRHDISNDLQVIFGYLDLMKETELNPPFNGYIDKVDASAHNIERQIAFTRDYQDIGVHSPVWQNVRSVISHAVQPLDISPIQILIEISGIKIYADPLIEKVFFNLVDNAKRYGDTITRIRIFGFEGAEGYIIICEDDGGGIPHEFKSKIFRREYYKHTGFGLYLSRNILEITGISIRETGVPGKGARFEILVPEGKYRYMRSDSTQENT